MESLSPFVSAYDAYLDSLNAAACILPRPIRAFVTGLQHCCRSGFRVNWQLPWRIPLNPLELYLLNAQHFVALPRFP